MGCHNSSIDDGDTKPSESGMCTIFPSLSNTHVGQYATILAGNFCGAASISIGLTKSIKARGTISAADEADEAASALTSGSSREKTKAINVPFSSTIIIFIVVCMCVIKGGEDGTECC